MNRFREQFEMRRFFRDPPAGRVVNQNSEVDAHHRCSVDHSGLGGAGLRRIHALGPIQAETRETERIPVRPALAWVLVAGRRNCCSGDWRKEIAQIAYFVMSS